MPSARTARSPIVVFIDIGELRECARLAQDSQRRGDWLHGRRIDHVANRYERLQPARLTRSPEAAEDNSRRPRTRTDVRTDRASGLIRILRADYPAVRRLLGADSFLRVAHGFVGSGHARAASGPHLAQAFPRYLRTLGHVPSIEYVANVADLEAARARARYAPDIAPLERRSFVPLSAAQFDDMSLIFHPSVSLVRSRFPIVAVWKANCSNIETTIDRWLPQSALIARPYRDVEVSVLPAGGYAFMAALADGSPIAAAIKAATIRDQNFDLGANLTMLVEANIVVDIRRPRMGWVGSGRSRSQRGAGML